MRFVSGFYPAGTIVASTTLSAAISTAAGSNTGNGTIGTLNSGPLTLPGVYIATLTSATAFAVVGPDGTAINNGVVGVAYNSPSGTVYAGLSATITAGTTPFVVGDKFLITVPGRGMGKAYNHASADGSQVAAGVLEYDLTVDSSGAHYYGQTALESNGGIRFEAEYWITGLFDTATLIGLDAYAVGQLGRFVYGNLTDGGDFLLLG
jgi:hypothetical protein